MASGNLALRLIGRDFVFHEFVGVEGAAEVTAKRQAICWLDDMLHATTGTGLVTELNRLRNNCLEKDGKPIFDSVEDIPLYLINLVLEKHHLYLDDDWE